MVINGKLSIRHRTRPSALGRLVRFPLTFELPNARTRIRPLLLSDPRALKPGAPPAIHQRCSETRISPLQDRRRSPADFRSRI